MLGAFRIFQVLRNSSIISYFNLELQQLWFQKLRSEIVRQSYAHQHTSI